MVRYLGALAKDGDSIVSVLVDGLASRLIYGFAIIFHATLTPTMPQAPGFFFGAGMVLGTAKKPL